MLPEEKVHVSVQLWSDQVGIINAMDDLDSQHPRRFWDNYFPGGHPVIYEFAGGRDRMVQALNPYA